MTSGMLNIYVLFIVFNVILGIRVEDAVLHIPPFDDCSHVKHDAYGPLIKATSLFFLF